MPVGGKTYKVEIAQAPEGAVVAYADVVLDQVGKLRLSHSDGSLSAVTADGSRVFDCGYVSVKASEAMKMLRFVIWGRFMSEDQSKIQVSEVALEHA